MARDKIKPSEYWEVSLTYYKNQIQRLELTECSTLSDEKRDRLYRAIFHYRLCYLVALYSAGAPINKVREAYQECLPRMKSIWSPSSSYVDLLWMVSLGVLLDASAVQVDALVSIYASFGLRDSLISFLLHYLNQNIKLCDSVLFEEPYHILFPITRVNGQVDPGSLIHDYLNKWYEGHNDAWWYDTHLSQTYIGYWCFEAAALVKILGQNEKEYYTHAFYPRLIDE